MLYNNFWGYVSVVFLTINIHFGVADGQIGLNYFAVRYFNLYHICQDDHMFWMYNIWTSRVTGNSSHHKMFRVKKYNIIVVAVVVEVNWLQIPKADITHARQLHNFNMFQVSFHTNSPSFFHHPLCLCANYLTYGKSLFHRQMSDAVAFHCFPPCCVTQWSVTLVLTLARPFRRRQASRWFLHTTHSVGAQVSRGQRRG